MNISFQVGATLCKVATMESIERDIQAGKMADKTTKLTNEYAPTVGAWAGGLGGAAGTGLLGLAGGLGYHALADDTDVPEEERGTWYGRAAKGGLAGVLAGGGAGTALGYYGGNAAKDYVNNNRNEVIDYWRQELIRRENAAKEQE